MKGCGHVLFVLQLLLSASLFANVPAGFDALRNFEAHPEIRAAIGGGSLVLNLVFQPQEAQGNRISREWLDRLLKRHGEAIADVLVEDKAKDVLRDAKQLRRIQEILLGEIANDGDLLGEYLRRTLAFQPARQAWNEIAHLALNKDGDAFLWEVRRAGKMGALPHQHFSEGNAGFVSVSANSKNTDFTERFLREPAWAEFVFWTLSRAAEAVAAATRSALTDALPVHAGMARLVEHDDKQWADVLGASMRRPASDFAGMIRSIIQRNDYCAIAWARTIAVNDEALARTFWTWLSDGGKEAMERWPDVLFSAGRGDEESGDALGDFRTVFEEFSATREGWERIANRLWIESAGPPQALRGILCITLLENPAHFWLVWRRSLECKNAGSLLKAKLSAWMRKEKIALRFLDAVADSNPDAIRLATDLWPRLIEKGSAVFDAFEHLIREKATGSAVYTLLLAVRQMSGCKDSTNLTLKEWCGRAFQNALGEQLWRAGKAYIFADWLRSSPVLTEAWIKAVLAQAQHRYDWFRQMLETVLDGDAHLSARKALARLLVEERVLFEQMLADPGCGFETLARKVMLENGLGPWLP